MDIGVEIQSKVNKLPFDLQEDVLRYVERLSSVNRTLSETEKARWVDERLLAKGLLNEIVGPMTDAEDAETELITIDGGPLSETIIAERR